MKKYKLKKDLPTFKAGDEFELRDNGNLYLIDPWKSNNHWATQICAYCKTTLDKFPNILKDWFEEIPEKPKTKWDLKIGDSYFYITDNGYVFENVWTNHAVDNDRRNVGNCFLTKEEAEKERARGEARVILERDTKGFKPDWRSGEYDKYEVVYEYSDDEHDGVGLHINDRNHCCAHNDLWFATKEDAKESIKNHEKEWKIYLGVGDMSK